MMVFSDHVLLVAWLTGQYLIFLWHFFFEPFLPVRHLFSIVAWAFLPIKAGKNDIADDKKHLPTLEVIFILKSNVFLIVSEQENYLI